MNTAKETRIISRSIRKLSPCEVCYSIKTDSVLFYRFGENHCLTIIDDAFYVLNCFPFQPARLLNLSRQFFNACYDTALLFEWKVRDFIAEYIRWTNCSIVSRSLCLYLFTKSRSTNEEIQEPSI